jgi:hypothetical protein
MPSSNLSIAVPTPAVAPGGTASFPPRTPDAVADFQEGIKRDPASFTIMKENKQQDHGVTPVAMIPSEPPDRLISFNLLSASDNISTFHGKRYRDNSWGAVHNGHHKAMISSVPTFERNIVDHRPVMIDRRMIRGAITTTGMRPELL